MAIKCFIIAAITADGFIAKDASHKANWTSAADKRFFADRTKKAGIIVMGSKTFDTIGKPLKDRRTIVYSTQKKYDGIEMTSESPSSLLSRLEKEGAKEVAICGGASIYTLFLDSGCVDTLYITVEPWIFGTGISLFGSSFEKQLELLKVESIGDGSVLLEYRVKK